MPPPSGMDGISGTTYQGATIPGGGNPSGTTYIKLNYVVLEKLPPNYPPGTSPQLSINTIDPNAGINTDANSQPLYFSIGSTTVWSAENITNNYIVSFYSPEVTSGYSLYLTAYYSVS
jgi:hypothetical protein